MRSHVASYLNKRNGDIGGVAYHPTIERLYCSHIKCPTESLKNIAFFCNLGELKTSLVTHVRRVIGCRRVADPMAANDS